MSFSSMTRSTKRRNRRGDAEMDLTSLIDVVFLLLIFFMVTSTMTGQADVEVPQAKHGKGVDPSLATIVVIRQPADADETVLTLGDNPQGAPVTIDDVEEAVRDGLTKGNNQVIIKAEKNVPHKSVLEVARVVGSIESGVLLIGVQELP